MKRIAIVLSILALATLLIPDAEASTRSRGYVRCDNGNGVIDEGDTLLDGVRVVVENGSVWDDITNDGENWYITLPDEPTDVYTLYLDPTTLPADATILVPPGGQYVFDTADDPSVVHTFLIQSEVCEGSTPGECWFTGGGVKFVQGVDGGLAAKGPHHNMGGNVYPGCNADSGADGGHWNHVAHRLKLHFKGNPITDVECGNVPGHPPGSDSPETPFNYIEYSGTGTLKGIKGNHDDYGTVYFFARAEDRNEPGSNGATDGEDIDRYFLHVFADEGDPEGTTLMLIDVDGDPSTVDPVMITGGNMQLHFAPCDN